jgi:hypothetical protein
MVLVLTVAPVGCGGQNEVKPTRAKLKRGDTPNTLIVGEFTADQEGKPPSGWDELTFDPDKFPKKSHYQVVKHDGRHVLEATTNGGVSGIIKRVDADWQKFPYLVWRWRVDRIYPEAQETTKEGDDYPARIYIAFRYESSRVGLLTRAKFEAAKRLSDDGRYPPLHVLNYVWASNLPADTWIPNPWQSRSKVIALHSGKAGLGEWHTECRNYVADFKAIVGEKPTAIDGIAIMIDGDGTNSKGRAYFDQVELRAKPPPDFPKARLERPTRFRE